MSDLMSERDVGKYIQEKILSAKKRGETEITLISGDIQKELFLQDGLEEICIAMQKLAEPWASSLFSSSGSPSFQRSPLQSL